MKFRGHPLVANFYDLFLKDQGGNGPSLVADPEFPTPMMGVSNYYFGNIFPETSAMAKIVP